MDIDDYAKAQRARTRERRERRRRAAVRAHLLDQLEALDGVRYARPDAQERPSDAPGSPNEPPRGSECRRCHGTGRMGYVDAGGDGDVDVCECVLNRCGDA